MTLTDAKDLATIIAAAAALGTLVKGVLEYSVQGALKRAEHFAAIRNRFKSSESFRDIAALVETDASALRDVAFKHKRDYLGLFEEVAILVNSRILPESVAFYMFGYYAVRCWQSQQFWEGLNRESPYWALFRSFAERMTVLEEAQPFGVADFHF